MASGVPSLFQIAQNVCIKQAAHILDVGDTPYHLVQPILKRLNAKQLAQLEENSPIVVPHTDELWGLLVERDFPDRPCSPSTSKISGTSENAKMPLRSLYQKYAVERDQFRATSADRLRKMTAKLRREKSKNAITTVHEVLADPTIRRRNTQYSGPKSTGFHKPKPTSILGKARRDVSQRSLMFGGPSKPYDPYKPFQSVSKPSEERPFSPPSRAFSRSPARANARPSSNIQKLPELPVSPSPNSPSSRETNNTTDSLDIQQPAVESQTSPVRDPVALRKRKPAPSIFLNTRKRPRPVPTKSPAGSGNTKQSAPESRPESKPIKAIKSSIFH